MGGAGGISWGAQQDLGFGFNGGFNTPFGGASGGFGWNQEQQDLFFGDIDSNLVNTDPTKPWAKVIEADGNVSVTNNKNVFAKSKKLTFDVAEQVII